MAEPLDLAVFERKVRGAARAWDEYARAEDPSSEATALASVATYRDVAGRTALRTLLGQNDVATSDLRAALADWVRVFTLRRITTPHSLAVRVARRTPRHGTEGASLRASWDDGFRAALSGKEPGSAYASLSVGLTAGPELARAYGERAAVRAEVDRELGLSHPSAPYDLPFAPIVDSAWAFLRQSTDVAQVRRDVGGHDDKDPVLSLAKQTQAATCKAAGDGWPARLFATTFSGWFGHPFAGFDLRPRLPRIYGASSFALALRRFGSSLRLGVPYGKLPFALTHPPASIESERFGFAFGSLAHNRHFQTRALKVSRDVAARQCKSLCLAAHFEAQRIAARVVLTDELRFAQREAFEEVSDAVFGIVLPPHTRGALPAPHEHVSDWLGLLETPALLSTLTERFDTDWFRNPKAYEWLRGQPVPYFADARFRPSDEQPLEHDWVAAAGALSKTFEAEVG